MAPLASRLRPALALGHRDLCVWEAPSRRRKKIKDVRPVYPQVAMATRARGTVVLDVTIGTDGKVQDAKVIHSVPQLDLAALEAVRQWEYEPTRVNGALVALIMTVVVNFAIQ
jgi:protein TonB